MAALLLLTAAAVWPRRTKVTLPDGRVIVIDKVTKGPNHISYSPFTLKTLWTMVTARLRTWPSITYLGQEGSVGVFYHSEPTPKDFADALYLVDRDGWWWAATSKGRVRESAHLAVFPPMRLPPSPHFEVWSNGVRTGGGVLQVRPTEPPAPREHEVSPFPVRRQKGQTLVVVHGVDVTTHDDVRPSEAEVHLRVERFRGGQPVRMKFGQVLVTNGEGRGQERMPDATGRFRTVLSPHNRYWTIQFLVDQDPSEPTDPEGPIDVDFVIRPQILGMEAATSPMAEAE